MMDTSRALSEASVLTSAVDDGEHGLAYYGSRYAPPRDASHRRSPSSRDDSIGHSHDSPDETGWRNLVQAVRTSWSEAKLTGAAPLPTRPASASSVARRPPSPRVRDVPVVDGRVSPVRSPLLAASAPAPAPAIVRGGGPVRGRRPAAAAVRAAGGGALELSAASIEYDPVVLQAPMMPQQHLHGQQAPAQRRPAAQARRTRSSAAANAAAGPTAVDAADLHRRVQALQRAVGALQEDKAHLESQQQVLREENEHFKQAMAAKDKRLQRLRGVKQGITALANMDKRNAELNSKRQQAIHTLENEVKNLFSGMFVLVPSSRSLLSQRTHARRLARNTCKPAHEERHIKVPSTYARPECLGVLIRGTVAR